ncbi:PKD domain-containing protein [Pyxidicoccus fallax]|uniref:PKD domain-containing protein n=2 Tax=Pyxidicoccus fallax TaxID=394095 RepID=A0A848L5W2_9BACT|nr:PKD domain-containing protein [Pyxidicoccus fallax]NMO14330.1 PKD domain-containing protein [Pyxidicoccus fallax]NPC84090.1 PKD domain-containing protein [Pyxidicoccus fallax]
MPSPRPTSLGTLVATSHRAPEADVEPEQVVRVERQFTSAPVPPAATGEALSAALNEERVVLQTSNAFIEGIDVNRPWVCTGEPMMLSARVGGMPEPDSVHRWVWPGAVGGAELHPGSRLQWRAPATPGRYFVRFQVCRDLGGRKVGVLAEALAGIDVRACGRGEGQEADSLRVEVTQQGPGEFVFRAVSSGATPLSAYTWDFGDGNSTATTEPMASHAYDTQEMGARDIRAFTVRLLALSGGGASLAATTTVLVRGQPLPDAPSAATLDVQREGEGGDWRSEVTVRVPEGDDVTWAHVERVTLHWDDQVDVTTRAWSKVITVEEALERGGFRGHVTVRAAEVSPDVRQVVDTLHGRDAAGREVVLSWASFKREAAPAATGTPARPPPKYP